MAQQHSHANNSYQFLVLPSFKTHFFHPVGTLSCLSLVLQCGTMLRFGLPLSGDEMDRIKIFHFAKWPNTKSSLWPLPILLHPEKTNQKMEQDIYKICLTCEHLLVAGVHMTFECFSISLALFDSSEVIWVVAGRITQMQSSQLSNPWIQIWSSVWVA